MTVPPHAVLAAFLPSAACAAASWEQAIAWYRRSIEANRNDPQACLLLAAPLAELGRLDEAQAAVKVGLALNPSISVSRARAAWTPRSDHPTYLVHTKRVLEGLRKAGLREQ